MILVLVCEEIQYSGTCYLGVILTYARYCVHMTHQQVMHGQKLDLRPYSTSVDLLPEAGQGFP